MSGTAVLQSSSSNNLTTAQQTNDTQGDVVTVGAGGEIGSLVSTDQGAVAAGKEIALAGLKDAQESSQAALGIADNVLKNKSQSDIQAFFKPIVWLAGIVAVVVVAVFFFRRH